MASLVLKIVLPLIWFNLWDKHKTDVYGIMKINEPPTKYYVSIIIIIILYNYGADQCTNSF